MKTIQISRLSYLRSPQEFKCQDSNQEGDKLVTAEDDCQKFSPRVAECWVFLFRSESDKGGRSKFSKAQDPQRHPAVENAAIQSLFQIALPFHTRTRACSHTVTQNKSSCGCSDWSVFLSLIPKAFKGKEPAINFRFVTQWITLYLLIFFLVCLWIFLRWGYKASSSYFKK